MRDKKVIEEMVSLAGRFGQSVEFDEFDGRGGWCRVKGSDRVIVNQRLTPREQIRILARVLAEYPIEEQAMPPKVRQIIEDARLELQPEPEPEPPIPEETAATGETAVAEPAHGEPTPDHPSIQAPESGPETELKTDNQGKGSEGAPDR